MNSFIHILSSAAFAYIAVVVFVFFIQRSLLYFPAKDILHPEKYGLYETSEEMLVADDNETIQIWFQAPAEKQQPVVVYLHGNADNLRNRIGIFKALLNEGFGFIGVSWRGFGKSTGKPTEKGLYADARAAIEFLKSKGFKEEQMIFYGESLGSGIAVQMGTEYNPLAVALQAPYTSVPKRAQEIYWFLPAILMTLDRFNSLAKIDRMNAPLLIIHGEFDLTIPLRHGQALFEKANEPKNIEIFRDTDHHNYNPRVIASTLRSFISTLNQTN